MEGYRDGMGMRCDARTDVCCAMLRRSGSKRASSITMAVAGCMWAVCYVGGQCVGRVSPWKKFSFDLMSPLPPLSRA